MTGYILYLTKDTPVVINRKLNLLVWFNTLVLGLVLVYRPYRDFDWESQLTLDKIEARSYYAFRKERFQLHWFYISSQWSKIVIVVVTLGWLGPLSCLGDFFLLPGLRWSRQRLPLLAVLAAHLEDLLHDLPVPHVLELLLLPGPALRGELHHVAGHHLVRGPGLGGPRHRSAGLSHPGAAVWENSETSHSEIGCWQIRE